MAEAEEIALLASPPTYKASELRELIALAEVRNTPESKQRVKYYQKKLAELEGDKK